MEELRQRAKTGYWPTAAGKAWDNAKKELSIAKMQVSSFGPFGPPPPQWMERIAKAEQSVAKAQAEYEREEAGQTQRAREFRAEYEAAAAAKKAARQAQRAPAPAPLAAWAAGSSTRATPRATRMAAGVAEPADTEAYLDLVDGEFRLIKGNKVYAYDEKNETAGEVLGHIGADGSFIAAGITRATQRDTEEARQAQRAREFRAEYEAAAAAAVAKKAARQAQRAREFSAEYEAAEKAAGITRATQRDTEEARQAQRAIEFRAEYEAAAAAKKAARYAREADAVAKAKLAEEARQKKELAAKEVGGSKLATPGLTWAITGYKNAAVGGSRRITRKSRKRRNARKSRKHSRK
jgi:hypothetical protein